MPTAPRHTKQAEATGQPYTPANELETAVRGVIDPSGYHAENGAGDEYYLYQTAKVRNASQVRRRDRRGPSGGVGTVSHARFTLNRPKPPSEPSSFTNPSPHPTPPHHTPPLLVAGEVDDRNAG